MNCKGLLVLLALSALPESARAQDSVAISSARETAKSGIADYYAGHYASACNKLRRAFEVVRVPTLALFYARALSKSGSLVEASEFYLIAARLPNGDGDAGTQERARRDAQMERIELLQRIPRLHIAIEGAPTEKVTVVANDNKVVTSLFATGWMVNPGGVKVVGSYNGEQVAAESTFAEGEIKTVTLAFHALSSRLPAQPIASTTPQPTKDQDSRTAQTPAIRYALWTSLGIGAAGLALGATTGIWALTQKNSLDSGAACRGTRCDRAAVGGEVDRYNYLRHWSTAGFITAAVGGTVAAVLYVGNVPDTPKSTARVTPWVGLASAGIAGTFE